MRLPRGLIVLATLFASAFVANPSYACINGARQCLTHIVYVCQNGYWVVTQGVCHHANDAGAVLLFNRTKMNVNYSKPTEGAKIAGNNWPLR
jgi:hypothetical protein